MQGIILLYYLQKGKIIVPTAFYPAFYFAGGASVFEIRNGSVWVQERYHFGGGNWSFEFRKLCIWLRENVV
jgi:hypothetical protein